MIMRQQMGHKANNERRANIVRTYLKDWQSACDSQG